MNFMKKFFPLSFKMAKDTKSFIWGIVIYVLAPMIVGAVTAIIGFIPVIGWVVAPVLGLAGGLLGLYCLAGLVILILVFAKVIKVDNLEIDESVDALFNKVKNVADNVVEEVKEKTADEATEEKTEEATEEAAEETVEE